MLLRPPGEGPVLRRERGSRHRRSVAHQCAPALWGGSGALGRGREAGQPCLPPSQCLPTDTLGITLLDVSLELEVRPRAASGLLFHLGRGRAPPYLQLQLREKEVGRAGGGVGALLPHRSVDPGQRRSPDSPAPPQVLLRADDGGGEFSTWVTCPAALCDGQWHRLAGEPGPPPPTAELPPRAFVLGGVPRRGSRRPPSGTPLGKQPGPFQPSYKDPVPAVTKGGNTLRLTVDTQTNGTRGPTVAVASGDALAPLHFGGLPGECGLCLGVGAAPEGPGAGIPPLPPDFLGWGSRGDRFWGRGRCWWDIGLCSNLSIFLCAPRAHEHTGWASGLPWLHEEPGGEPVPRHLASLCGCSGGSGGQWLPRHLARLPLQWPCRTVFRGPGPGVHGRAAPGRRAPTSEPAGPALCCFKVCVCLDSRL